jgi:hypothetical protein
LRRSRLLSGYGSGRRLLSSALLGFCGSLELRDDDGGRRRCSHHRLFLRRFRALTHGGLHDGPRRTNDFLLLLRLRLVLAHDHGS